MNQAAKKLFMTQSSLSVAIGSLEKELGFLLLERTNAGVILTDKGKKVFEETQIVLNYINGWKQKFKLLKYIFLSSGFNATIPI